MLGHHPSLDLMRILTPPSSFSPLSPAARAVSGRRIHGTLGDFIPPLLLRRAPGLRDITTDALKRLVDVITARDEVGLAVAVVRSKRVAIDSHRG